MGLRRTVEQLAAALAAWTGLMVLSGLGAATLIRLAPGFGMDERLLDARLSIAAREALEHRVDARVLPYYADYGRRLARGDLGVSLSHNRPVRELLGERLATSIRSGSAGLGGAWAISLAAVAALEWLRRRSVERVASLVSAAALCVPAAVAALACVYTGSGAAMAIAVILLPRLFRWLRSVIAQASSAPHVLAAHAMGIPRPRVLALHVVAPAAGELAALGGVSVSMMAGAAIPAEALCDSAGIGQLLWQAALSRDVPVLVNVTLLLTAVIAGSNLLAGAARRLGPAGA